MNHQPHPACPFQSPPKFLNYRAGEEHLGRPEGIGLYYLVQGWNLGTRHHFWAENGGICMHPCLEKSPLDFLVICLNSPLFWLSSCLPGQGGGLTAEQGGSKMNHKDLCLWGVFRLRGAKLFTPTSLRTNQRQHLCLCSLWSQLLTVPGTC